MSGRLKTFPISTTIITHALSERPIRGAGSPAGWLLAGTSYLFPNLQEMVYPTLQSKPLAKIVVILNHVIFGNNRRSIARREESQKARDLEVEESMSNQSFC